MSVSVSGVVVLGASDFDLLETPLRKIGVSSAEVAAQDLVFQSESGIQSPDLAAVTRSSVSDNLNLPVILLVTDSQVTVRRDLLVTTGDGGGNVVRVEVASSLSVDQTDIGAIGGESKVGRLRVVILLTAVRVEEPVVVGILVVVAGNLLLTRTRRIGLDVGVKKTTTIAHVLDGNARTVSNLERAVSSDFSALEVGLEKGAHLSITRATLVEDGKVKSEGKEVDEEGDDDKSNNSGDNVSSQGGLEGVSVQTSTNDGNEGTYNGHLSVAELVPEVLNSVDTDKSSDEKTDELDTADAANANTGHQEPEEPLRLEAVVSLVVELGPAENSGNSSAKKHRVEENEAANGGIGVLAKDHESNEPNSRALEMKLSCSVVGHRNADNAEEGIEGTHEGIVDIFGVLVARFEFERTVITSEDSGETNEHLAKGRMDIEVVFVLDVVATELAKTENTS